MDATEEKELRAWQAELADTSGSRWQPRMVARAFARVGSPFVLTMQGWIDLDARCSPFLEGRLPVAEDALEEFRAAFGAFGYTDATPEACDGSGLALLGVDILQAIEEAFAMRLKVRSEGSSLSETGTDAGLGGWLPLLAFLVSQMHLSLAEAKSVAVGQAFALLAAHRVNQGWYVTGETYASQDVPDEVVEEGEA